jgi:eukaryotic-like serine/threonine-protein kinase
MDESTLDRASVLTQLERVLSSSPFRRAERSSALLRFIVEETLDGRADRLKEYTLGAEALRRGESFDPRADPVVRAEASRLRARLDQYYETSGQTDPIVISLSKGGYVPQFLPRTVTHEAETQAARPWRSTVFEVAKSPAVAWTCAVGAAVVAAFSWWQVRSIPAPTSAPAQFEVELKSNGVLPSDVGTTVVVSPDGSRMVFVSRATDGRTRLNIRSLDRSDTIDLAGTDGARGPFVSPDGRWVGFWADGKLKKIAIDGGLPVVLCDASDLLGASWGDDDTIVAAVGAPGQLARIPASGGAPSIAIDLTAESMVVRWPQLLPGGGSVIYTAMTGAGADRANIEVQSVRGGNRKILVKGGTFGRYLRNGYLTYVNQGTLYAVRFDLSALDVRGAPIPLLDDVAYSPLFGHAQLDVSHAGLLVYRRGTESEHSVVQWIDRSGRGTALPLSAGRYGWLRLSPDGQRLALTRYESGIASISIYEPKTNDMARLTTRPGDYTGLTWLSDGIVAFGGSAGLGWARSSGLTDTGSWVAAGVAQTPWSVTREGHRLAYYERSAETGFDLWTVPVLQTDRGPSLGQPEPFLRTRAFEVYPSFSPDGRWIAYASNESGIWEIYVRRFPDNGTKVRISTAGGVVPRWSPNGSEVIYRTDAQQLMVASYKAAGDSFVVATPRPWSELKLADTGVLPNFDVAPDGERILALMPAPAKAPQTENHVTVMFNFDEQVRRRAESR